MVLEITDFAGTTGVAAGVVGAVGAAGAVCAKAVALAAANIAATKAEISLFMDIPLKELTFNDRQVTRCQLR